MADDVLSQSEIDKLLSAISSGDVSADEVKAEEQQKKEGTVYQPEAVGQSADFSELWPDLLFFLCGGSVHDLSERRSGPAE